MVDLPAGFELERKPGPRIENLPEGFQIEPKKPASQGPIADTLASFNDTMTFGLWPKAMEMFGMGDEPARVAAMRKENPIASIIGDVAGYTIPGMGASSLVSKAVPALAKNTIRSIAGREMIANAGMTGAEQITRGSLEGDPFGDLNIPAITMSGVTGGLMGGAVAAGSRINPVERMRAAGVDLSQTEIDAARMFYDEAHALGIPVNVMESVKQTGAKGASRLEGEYNANAGRPSGMRQAQEFDIERNPIIRETGREMVDELGGGIAPQEVTTAAKDVFSNIREGANLEAAPYYKAADARSMPPSWVPKHPYIDDARARIASGEGAEGMALDMSKRWTSSTGKPAPMPQNSVMYLDEVRQEMQREIGREMAKPAPNNDYIAGLQNQLETLTGRMDAVAPTYPEARGIFETAMGRADDLRAGPLNSLENPGMTAESQAGTVFGVNTGADAANSSAALSELGAVNPDVPKGLLANHIDGAVSSDVARPDMFGSQLLPNQHSMGLVDDVLGPGGSPLVKARLEAARAVSPNQARNDAQLSGLNPRTIGFDYLLNFGSDNAVRGMQDPNFFKQLGKTGPTHEAAQSLARSTNQTSELGETLAEILGLRTRAAAR